MAGALLALLAGIVAAAFVWPAQTSKPAAEAPIVETGLPPSPRPSTSWKRSRIRC
jgi:hypothetical protein